MYRTEELKLKAMAFCFALSSKGFLDQQDSFYYKL